MTIIQKRLQKFYRKPVPNDITFDDVKAISEYYGCIVVSGGNHSKKIIHPQTGTVIPIPMHGKTIKEAYIKELKKLFEQISSGKENA